MAKHVHPHVPLRGHVFYAYMFSASALMMFVMAKVHMHALFPANVHDEDNFYSVLPPPTQSLRSVASTVEPITPLKKTSCPPADTSAIQKRVLSKNDKTRPCAILFFGLPKQFKSLVLPSIQKNILEINPECDVYAHAYNVSSVTSTRNKEKGTFINATEILELTPNVILETNEEFEEKRDLDYFRQDRFFPQHMGWEFPTSMDNMIKQWHSIEQVWELMEDGENKLNIKYERVALLRSDVFYANPINVMDGKDAVAPLFASNPANDRMFYGSYDNAKVWATIRFPSVECYKPRKPHYGLHSEHFMRDFIHKRMSTKVKKQDVCFFRVRATGLIMSDDCRCADHNDCDSVRNKDVVEIVSSIVNKPCTAGKGKYNTPKTYCPISE